MSAPRQRDRVVFAKLDSPPRQPYSFGDFLVAVDHPTIDLAPCETPRGHGMRGGEFQIEFDGLTEQQQRFIVGLLGLLIKALHSAQVEVVSVQALGWLSLGPLDLSLLQLWHERTNDAHGHLV